MQPNLESFRDWLKTKPANGTYEFRDIRGCCVAQYLRFLGLPVDVVTPDEWTDIDGKPHYYPKSLNAAANPHGVFNSSESSTFGGALKRVEDLLNGAEPVSR